MARYSAILIDVNGEVLLDSERILTGPNLYHIVKHIAFEKVKKYGIIILVMMNLFIW